MKFIIAALCSALLVFTGFAPHVSAQSTAPVVTCPPGSTLVAAYTKKNGTAVAAHCKKGKKKGAAADTAGAEPAAAAAPATPAPAMPAAVTPAPAMATSAPAMGAMHGGAMKGAMASPAADGSMTCPDGKTFVKGYTTKKGTKVAGYCRKSRAKKS